MHLLMIGSREDEMCSVDMENEYRALLSLINSVEIKMFDFGSHPLILSRAVEICQLIRKCYNKKGDDTVYGR